MYIKLPDEQGWYWAECHDGCWLMAFVDTGREVVILMDGDNPDSPSAHVEFDEIETQKIKRWFGPFQCPGGDFGGSTVVKTVEDYALAKKKKNAIVVVHVDYLHCRAGHGANITITSVVPREKADTYIYRERDEIAEETKANTQ